jgi:hypothetical protein
LHGKVVRIVDDTIAIIETKYGTHAMLDINDVYDYRLRVGDLIEVEDAGWYVEHGHIVTVLGTRYKLNGFVHTVDHGE